MFYPHKLHKEDEKQSMHTELTKINVSVKCGQLAVRSYKQNNLEVPQATVYKRQYVKAEHSKHLLTKYFHSDGLPA